MRSIKNRINDQITEELYEAHSANAQFLIKEGFKYDTSSHTWIDSLVIGEYEVKYLVTSDQIVVEILHKGVTQEVVNWEYELLTLSRTYRKVMNELPKLVEGVIN